MPRPILGLVTADDEAHIPPEALKETTGAVVEPDSPVIFKVPGRAEFNGVAPGTGAGSCVALGFGSAQDRLLLKQGANLYITDVGDTGSFTTLKWQKEQLTDADTDFVVTAGTTPLTATKFGDQYLVADGVSRPFVVENNGRARPVGLSSPVGDIVLSQPAGAEARVRATTAVDATALVFNPSAAIDTDIDTFTYLIGDSGGPIATQITYHWAGAAGFPTVGRTLLVLLSSLLVGPISIIRYQFELSTNFSSALRTWTIIRAAVGPEARFTFEHAIPDGVAAADLAVRFTLFLPGDLNGPATAQLNLFDIVLAGDASAGFFSTTSAGLRYGFTEKFSYTRELPGFTEPQSLSVESDLSPLAPDEAADPLTFAGWLGVNGAFPPLTNSYATSRVVYRSTDAANEETTRVISGFSKIAEVDAATNTFTDRFDEDGHPMDYSRPAEAPPFIFHLGNIQAANAAPPSPASVIGLILGYVTYASDDFPGQFWWARSNTFDYVPGVYTDGVSGLVTGFVDVGVGVVTTNEEVVAYTFLPDASSAQFIPADAKRPIFTGRGFLSRRGITVVALPNSTPVVLGVMTDGIWWTNGVQGGPWSQMLDWPVTLDVTQLASAELLHQPSKRRILLAYYDSAGRRQGLGLYYARGSVGVAAYGPFRLPSDSVTVVNRNGVTEIFSSEDGIVYREGTGEVDAALLENALGTISFAIAGGQQYPFGPRGKGVLREFLVHTKARAGASLDLVITPRIDDGAVIAAQPFTIPLDNPGWKTVSVQSYCTSFGWRLSTSGAMPGIVDVMWIAIPQGEVLPEGVMH